MKAGLFKTLIIAGAGIGLAPAGLMAEGQVPTTGVNPETQSETIGQKINDATTTARVKSRLIINENTDGLRINVDTRNSEVTLNGTVKSETEKSHAEDIARSTNGVRSVQNQLKVASRFDGSSDSGGIGSESTN